MLNDYILFSYFFMWGVLVFVSICFLISGIDDLFFDLYYWGSTVVRRFRIRKKSKLTYEKLCQLPEKKIAVMIACWHEAGVIEKMLEYNMANIDYQHYDVFVGVYPNDKTTVQAVMNTKKKFPHIQCVINKKQGPTNKADNLNTLYEYIMEYETQHGKYDIFVIHDSEDIIHSLSLKFFNYLIPKKAMVQIPIFPLEVSLYHMTHWTYAAEFSEIHTKDIFVRERIGGLVPSAGVATAFACHAIDVLKHARGGLPFSTNTLTEDYSTALQIRLHGLKQIFAFQYVYRTRWVKRWYFFGPIIAKRVKEYIAARALFPMTYMKAVRQKTRWILGISFQEWINTGWTGNLSTIYTLMHDRKAIFAHLITGIFFILIPFWLLYSVFCDYYPEYPTLQEMFIRHPWVWNMIMIASILMVMRMIQRLIAVKRVYGWVPAFWSVLLILYSNIINLHALLRAYSQFLYTPSKTKQGTSSIAWDKTDHEFPVQHLLVSSKLPLGSLLLHNQMITKKMLITAVDEQSRSGKRLGTVLVELGYATQEQIVSAIAKQYQLETVSKNENIALPHTEMTEMSLIKYKRLVKSGHYPIKIDGNLLTISIDDPSNELLIAKIIKWAKPYDVTFVMVT